MPSLNRVFLIGNLTRDPEVRYTPGGKAVSDLRLAVNRKYRTADGQDREETCFVTSAVWGKQAENCANYLKKGSPVFIEGRLKYDEWEKEGQKFNRLTTVAERVQFLSGPRKAEFQDADGAPADQRPPDPGPEAGPAHEAAAGGDEDNLPF